MEALKDESSTEVVTWRSYLPTTVLRVLLVEADDSTRHVITALLRKCNYTVVAVSDGLSAWETIKVKHDKIDLILTEAELPSVSGFALLSLVIEHDISKHIPVIMMSSQESVNMVLKCMQKGAADYLIKPVRRNELTNMWQHVWRRQNILVGGQVTDNLAVSQQKVEATAASNRSDDYETASKLSNRYIEMLQNRGRMDKESVVHENETKEKAGTFGSDIAPLDEALNSVAPRLKEEHTSASTMGQDENLQEEVYEYKAKPTSRTPSCQYELAQPAGEVRDLLGAFDNWSNSDVGTSDSKADGMKHFELELSLRSSDSSQKLGNEERPALNHSYASAFSRYNNSRGSEKFFLKLPSTNFENARSNSHGRQVNVTNFVDVDIEQEDPSIRDPQLGIVSDAGDNICAGNSHSFRSLFVVQSGLTPMLGTKSVNHITQFPVLSEKGDDHFDKNTEKFIDHTLFEKHKLENMEHLEPSSPAASQSCCSSLGNGTVDNHISSSAHGSNCSSNDRKASSAAAGDMSTTSGSVNDSGRYVREGFGVDSVRASQREEALLKFRLKRKDRCFEKKVRYQSRKILAEKRPRVKGQFMHYARADSAAANAIGT